MNAVVKALNPLGVRHLDIPASPQRIWRAIQDSRSDGSGRMDIPARSPLADRHRQSKGKKRVAVPIHRDLKKVLDHVPKRSTLILTTPTGVPWKADWFRNRWLDVPMPRLPRSPVTQCSTLRPY
jgi:hypothetical protein